MILIVAFWGHPVYAFYTRKDGFLKKKSEPIGGTATPIVSPLNSPLDASLFLHLAAHKRRHILFVHWRRNEFESWGGGHRLFCGRGPPLFGSTSTISRFGERFRGGQ